MEHGPFEIHWENKVDSPIAEIIMCYGDGSRWHNLWLIPLCALFFIANFAAGGIILVERKIVNRKSKRSNQHEHDQKRTL